MKGKFITAKEAVAARDNRPDMYDVNVVKEDELSQLIEETAVYTNFLVLKGLPKKYNFISKWERRGFYVNTFQNFDGKPEGVNDWYTLIKWPKK